MAQWLTVALCLAAALLAVPCAVVFVQVCAAGWLRPAIPPQAGSRPRVAVLMPAHNESAVIAESLRHIVMQRERQDRLVVVADNCDDDTAAIAAAAGAEVVERFDQVRRGKGYALDAGLNHLRDDPPEVVVVIDADCRVAPHALARLAVHCHHTGQPVQALYLMESPAGSGGVPLAAFAWRLKNWVRPLGMARLGLPCQLMGTGMAFPWRVAQRLDLAHGGLVEDMQLGVELALAGTPPCFLPEAQVTSVFPVDAAAQATQRTRWEHGHLGMILHGVPRLLSAGIRHTSLRVMALALDLVVPPLALLAFAAGLLGVAGVSLGYVLSDARLALIANLPLLLLVVAVAVAWHRWGQDLLPPVALLGIPRYVAAKLPLYLRFFTRRERAWVKTGRD